MGVIQMIFRGTGIASRPGHDRAGLLTLSLRQRPALAKNGLERGTQGERSFGNGSVLGRATGR